MLFTCHGVAVSCCVPIVLFQFKLLELWWQLHPSNNKRKNNNKPKFKFFFARFFHNLKSNSFAITNKTKWSQCPSHACSVFRLFTLFIFAVFWIKTDCSSAKHFQWATYYSFKHFNHSKDSDLFYYFDFVESNFSAILFLVYVPFSHAIKNSYRE